MKCVEEVGLLKMDFLGLRTLTVVHEAVRLVRESRGISIDINNLEPDDDKTYALLRSGMTSGIFQLESSGMRDLAKRIGLQSLEEMSALVALYRPGPMQFIDTYIEGKFKPRASPTIIRC
jgi:DNA polymerase-3 subunit alpha